jgi:phospholipid/cholesterol/gamma-HCH transport system permease protein
VTLAHVGTDHQILLDQVSESYAPCETAPPQGDPFVRLLERVGESVIAFRDQAVRLLGFMGLVVIRLGGLMVRPRRFPVTSLFNHLEQVGLNAVPIIALITFLIGGVLAFLGSDILETFGAKVYVINLISFAFLREFGVLLAAIMVAGRSGSAFTAQIGSMKAREEIDAMQTLGLDPVERLVVPRVVALVIALPLLTFIADMMGLFGGGVIAWLALDLTPWHYLARLEAVTELQHFWVGLIKAPFFAFVIAVIGCHQGLMVEGTAESVGRRTTLAVVQAIFLVIVLDALFAIFFIEIGY